MRSFTASSLLLAAASVTSALSASDLSTISRTSIHTSCPSAASTKAYGYYGNSTIASIASSTESDTIEYETDVYTKDSTVTLVSTSCSADKCEVTTILESLTTVVATVDGILTTYVTGIPITPTTTASAEPTTTAGEDVTVTAPSTTVVTITSCHNDVCKKTAVTTGATVVTTEVDGVKTVYTTYCPLSGETTATSEATPTSQSPEKTNVVTPEVSSNVVTPEVSSAPVTVTKPSTTIITITSCKDNKCHEIPVTTGVSAYTTTINGVVTAFTTYCPLSSESTTVPETPVESIATPVESIVTPVETTVTPVSESTVTPVFESTVTPVSESTVTPVSESTVTPVSESTVNVITNNIVTQTVASTSSQATSAVISIYEGAANRAVPAALALPLLYLLL